MIYTPNNNIILHLMMGKVHFLTGIISNVVALSWKLVVVVVVVVVATHHSLWTASLTS